MLASKEISLMGASSGGMRASKVWSARKFWSPLFAPGRCTQSPLSMLPERAPLWPSMLLEELFTSTGARGRKESSPLGSSLGFLV